MRKTPFIWLGANRARKWPVGEKGRLLDKAAHAGLPVPPGAILLDEVYQLLLEAGVILADNGYVTAPDPDWLFETFYEGVRFPRLNKPMLIRRAFSLDGAAVSAPPYPTLVDLTDPDELARALTAVWSFPQSPPTLRRDALLLGEVAGEVWGTAVTTPTTPDQTTYQTPESPPTNLTLPQLGRFGRTTPGLPAFAQRLQKLLRGCRRTLGPANPWQIEWRDDGHICWLIQITPLPL
jgi:rifampicin phosphotransferase